MTGYILRRLGQAIVVLLVVALIVFLLLKLLPGGAARAILGPKASPGAISAFDKQNGLDQPLIVQYVSWLWRLVHWNLGYSYRYNENVSSLLGIFLPKTALLVGSSTALSILLAVPLGLWQAYRRNRVFDRMMTGLELMLYSMPTFFLGVILILYLAVDHRVFPSEAPQGGSIAQIVAHPLGLVLPVATLTLVITPLFARYMRSAAIDVLSQDYLRTAASKGLRPTRMILRHVLRNSTIPLVTLIGLSLPTLITGAVVTESVFNYPGMGLAFWNAAQNRDYAVLLGFTMVTAIATVAGALLADLAYLALDPRVRLRP